MIGYAGPHRCGYCQRLPLVWVPLPSPSTSKIGFPRAGLASLSLPPCTQYTAAMRLSFRRWWLWSAVALLLVGLLSATVLYISFGLSHRDRVTMSHIGRLKLGMKEAEVRRILGEA